VGRDLLIFLLLLLLGFIGFLGMLLLPVPLLEFGRDIGLPAFDAVALHIFVPEAALLAETGE
jgi:hypothetical protein